MCTCSHPKGLIEKHPFYLFCHFFPEYHQKYLKRSTSNKILILFIADLIAIGDIESFFNENFFKKVPAQERKIDHRHNAEEIKFNGVPESQYEPYYNTYIPYNSTRPRLEKSPISSKQIFTKKHGLSSDLDQESKSFTSGITATQRAFMKNNILDQHDNKVCYIELFIIIRQFYSKHKHSKPNI